MESLLRVFIDAEKTGTSHQFYDKFNLRYYFCQLFGYLIEMVTNSSHLENLIKISKTQKQVFLEFANLYLNDLIFLLDESLSKLMSIKKIEELDTSEFSEQVKAEKRNELKALKGQAKTFTVFLNVYYTNIALISQYA